MNDERERIRCALDHALSGVEEIPQLEARILAQRKAHVPMRKKAPLGFLLAAALLLTSLTAAAAEHLGLLDRLLGRGAGISSEAAALITAPPVQHTLDWQHVSLRVTEALRTDHTAAVLVEVAPASEELLIVPEEWLDDTAIPDGRQLIALRVHTPSLRRAGEAEATLLHEGCTCEPLRTEDGTLQLLFLLQDSAFDASSGTVDVRLRFETFPVEAAEDGFTLVNAGRAPATIAFPLEYAPDAPVMTARYGFSHPVNLPECGVRIDGVTLSAGRLHTRLDLTCTVTDRSVYDSFPGGFIFAFTDADGEFLQSGFGGARAFTQASENVFRISQYVQHLPEQPAALHLRIYGFGSALPLASATLSPE